MSAGFIWLSTGSNGGFLQNFGSIKDGQLIDQPAKDCGPWSQLVIVTVKGHHFCQKCSDTYAGL